MGTSFTDTSFILAVEDPERSAAYYCEVLGFHRSDLDLGEGWRVVERDRCRICLGGCAENDDWIPPSQVPYHNWFAYIAVDDLESYYAILQTRGAAIAKVLTTNPDGSRDFSVRTIDGHGIMFGRGKQEAGHH